MSLPRAAGTLGASAEMPTDEDEAPGPPRLPPDPYHDGWWYLTIRTTVPPPDEPEESEPSDDDS